MDYTPFLIAATGGHTIFIKTWIASGREINLGVPGSERSDAIFVTKRILKLNCSQHAMKDRPAVVAVLESFRNNPDATRHAIRNELGWYDESAASLFALVVFVSDYLLQVPREITFTASARFLAMMEKLPLELQMFVCYRVVGSSKEIISQKHGEVAFKNLAKAFLVTKRIL